MIDRLKCYVKHLPFYQRRKLWREITDLAEHEKYHRCCMESYRAKKLELIRQYEKLKMQK